MRSTGEHLARLLRVRQPGSAFKSSIVVPQRPLISLLAGNTATHRSLSMSVAQELPKASSSTPPTWYEPQREVEEPVLRVYNSLTRSKVCDERLFQLGGLNGRMCSSRGEPDKSIGTTAVPQCMTCHTWVMLGQLNR